MFKVFDRKKKQLDLLENPMSPVITNELGGIGELTFSVPSTYKHLELEGYIQVENDHEYVIKEIVTHGTNRDVVCMLNIEEILGMAWSKFISRDNTLMKCAELVLNGTGWRAIDKSSCKVKRNLYGTVTNSYNLLQMMCTVYNVEFIFDTYNKTVTFVDKVGKDAGVYFINDINLKQLNVDTHTHKYITRVIPVGKDGLTIESVNNGKNYLENKTYTDKNIYGIWQSDKHDNPKALMDDAKRFLDEMAVPYETYEVLVDDLYALKGYDEFKYGLGDVVTIIDGDTETRIQQRVIQRTYNLLEPDKDTIHIANKDATFEDYYKRLQTIADMTQSVIGSDGTISGGNISDGTISGDKIENDSINSDHISSGSITSTHIKAEQILADHIMSNQITTNHLVADSITSDHIQANSIDTKHLKANIITSDHIQSNTINSNHINSNTITAGHIQSGAITAGSGIIADGAIGNAQISKIDAGKIEAGTIDTSRVTIQGANGHLRLKGNRMQVFQGTGNQAKERVSVGDVNGDGTVYGLRVRGADGQTVLLDENGVTSEGITNGSITNDKINEDANIDGAKLNINSVINKINTDGTEVIQGTKVEVDGTNLGVKLSEITNKQTSDGEKITQAQAQITANQNAIKLKVDEQVYTTDKKDMTSKLEKNTSEISAMKGQIALKVEQTDIENAKNEIEGVLDSKLDTTKAEIKVTTDAISQNVSKLSQTVSNKADGTTVTTLSNKVGSLETSVNGISGKVTNLESTTTTLGGRVDDVFGDVGVAIDKANNAQTTANNANSTANTNKGNITNLQGEVNTVKSDIASLEVTTSGISQKVSSVESTTVTLTTKVNAVESTANNAVNKANNAQSTANANKNNITNLQCEVTTVKNNVASLEVTTSGISQKVSSVETTTTTLTNKVNTAQSTANQAKTDASTANSLANSAMSKADSATTLAGSKAKVFTKTPTVPYQVGDLWVQGTNGDVMKCKTARTSGNYTASDWEKASKYTDDTKANAVDNKVNTLQTTVNTTSSKVSSLETTLSGITSRVANVETTTTALDGKVTNQETRLSEAEQKITDKAITSVVQESQFIKDMDGKISTNKSNISKVEQTANSISSKVSDLSGKYTEIKQTVDGIDLTGKVSFSDLSTAGKTTINGANIDTTNLRVRGELISGQINGVGGIRFADGAVISSYDSHVVGYKGISISAPSVKLGDQVAIYHPTMYYDVVGKNNTSSATTTWTMSSTGALSCASASLSGTLDVSGQANLGSVVTNGLNVYGNTNLSGTLYTSGQTTCGMIKTDSYRFTNNHIAFSKNDYNNNMMNGCNWDWQYYNLVNVKVYPVTLSLPTIDESTIQTVSKTQKDTLSQIKFPEARELSVEESAPSIDISDVTNKEEITTNGDVDLIKLVYLLVKDVQELKSEVDSLKQENNELKLLLNKGE